LHAKLPFPIDFVTKVQTQRARIVEIGFRTKMVGAAAPPAYEWESQHRAGDYDKVGDEAVMLTGDENLADVNVSVQYRVIDAARFLFAASDVEAIVRTVSETVVREVVGRTPLDPVLTTGRALMERDCLAGIARRLQASSLGVEVRSIRFQDVHPPIEVVPAFREVANAYEEKNKLVNEAEAYRNEQIPTARGEAEKRLREALAFRIGRVHRARGDADRFVQRLRAYRGSPEVTRTRLYWEAMEQVLPGRKKLILDKKNGGRRQLLLLETGGVSLNLATGEVQKQPKPESPAPPPSKAKPFGPEEE
jgi:HflK protein